MCENGSLREPVKEGRGDISRRLGGTVSKGIWKTDMESFHQSCEKAQYRDHWRLKIKRKTANPVIWKMAIKGQL